MLGTQPPALSGQACGLPLCYGLSLSDFILSPESFGRAKVTVEEGALSLALSLASALGHVRKGPQQLCFLPLNLLRPVASAPDSLVERSAGVYLRWAS